MTTETPDKSNSCPKCGTVNSLELDSVSGKYRCTRCRETGLDVGKKQLASWPTSPVSDQESVIDNYQDGEVVKIIKIRCPIDKTIVVTNFDEHSPAAKFAKKRLKTQVQQEKRYGREKLKSGKWDDDISKFLSRAQKPKEVKEETIESILDSVDLIMLKYKNKKLTKEG